MQLADIPAFLIQNTVRKWRRRAIALAAMAVCAIVVLIEVFAAARAAATISFGPVNGHLVLAAVALGLMAVVGLLLWWMERRRHADTEQSLARDQRVSLIAEAIDLGYTIAREMKQPRPPAEPDAETVAAAAAAEAELAAAKAKLAEAEAAAARRPRATAPSADVPL